MQWILFVRTVSIKKKKTKTVQKKTKQYQQCELRTLFIPSSPDISYQLRRLRGSSALKVNTFLSSAVFTLQLGPKFLRHSKAHDAFFFLFLFLICKVPFHLPLSRGQHQVASDWLIRVIPLNAKREGEKKHPLFFQQQGGKQHQIWSGIWPRTVGSVETSDS